MRSPLGWVLVGGALVLSPSVAWAQSATVRAIVRVVKTAPSGAGEFKDARIGSEVTAGGRVRTGGRSGAGIRFPEGSIVRLGELTEIEVTNPGRRDVKVNRGKLFSDYRRPGTITGGHTVAAVRGTKTEFIQDGDKEHVRCYGGTVYVAASDNPIYAGTTAALAAATLTDPALIGMNIDWKGGEVRFTSGPYAGQKRQVTAFDSQAGTVTLDAPLTQLGPGGGESDYILSKLPGRKIVLLTRNTGTTVAKGGEPQDPYNVPSEQFANVERNPYFRRMADGRALYTFPGTIDHDEQRRDDFATRLAIEQLSSPARQTAAAAQEDPFCDVVVGPVPGEPRGRRMSLHGRLHRQLRQDCEPAGASTQALALGEGKSAPTGSRLLALNSPSTGGNSVAGLLAQASTASPPGGRTAPLPTPEQVVLPGSVRPSERFTFNRNMQFRLEPFAIGSDEGEALGARARVQGTAGELFAEFGYLFRYNDGDTNHDLSEAFMHLRGSYGDLILGRQHLFLRIANNQDIGALLGLDSTDAFVYQLPLTNGFRQMAGYILNSQAVGTGAYPGNFSGAFARGQAPVGGGVVGYTLLGSDDFPDIGWSVDAAMPVIKNVLDLYGEAGIDPAGRNLFTAGIYIPALYHAAKLDTFIEYAHRENIQDRFSLRFRREIGSGFLLVAFLDHVSKSGFDGGGGLMWSRSFR